MRAPALVLACPFSFFPLLPPGSLPPSSVFVSLCCVSFCPSLVLPFRQVPAAPLTVSHCPVAPPCPSVFSRVLLLVVMARSSAPCWICFCPFGCLSHTVARDAPPSVSVAPSGFLVFCRLCSVCPFLFAVGPLFLFCLGDLIGDVGLASSHGLDRTAANYTGADQLSSLPCRPERPRAAKSAHMVRSVGFVCIAKITLLIVPYISACCCDLLLTAWTV